MSETAPQNVHDNEKMSMTMRDLKMAIWRKRY